MVDSEETVTLLRWGPRSSRHPPSHRSKDKKSDKFSFKFRRRSKSAPRHRPVQANEGGRIVYSANGETKVKNPDSPFKSSGSVQLVGFSTWSGASDDGGCHSLDSADTSPQSQCIDSQYRASSDSRTLSRTSKDIKMERERLRQERLHSSNKPWQTDGWCDSLRRERRSPAAELISQILTEERDRPLLFSRLAGATPAFSAVDSGSQLIPSVQSDSSDAMEGERTRERIIPITITTQTTTTTERIIPVMVESSDSSTEQCDSSSTQSNDSTPCEDERPDAPPPPLPLSSLGRTGLTFHHPSFANHFGLARLRQEERNIFSAGGGIRDSFPGFPSFGNFPSFTPLLQGERQFPAHFRDKSKAAAIHKQRVGKSKSSVDYTGHTAQTAQTSSDKQTESFRYVQDEGEEEEDQYGDSESESEDDDLDSVSLIADRNRDSTHSHDGSTHSHDGSTHSQDSGLGISEEQPRIREKYSECRTKPRRPDSAVPSEYSVVSDSSSLEDEKSFRISEVKARIVPISQPSPEEAEQSQSQNSEEDLNRLNKAYEIACELLKTEIHYVAILHLIDQVFHFRVDRENRSHHMFSQDVVTTIFSNIKSIYLFHAEHVLPQLKDRIDKWKEGPQYQRIGDIMVKNAPFLKMYTEYVKNFDTAMNTMNTLYNKNSKFSAIVDDIHAMVECENLSLQHHMLTPIQRIPRYEMLLKDYLSKLPDNSPDRLDSESALQQVSQAASHANDSMKRIEQFKKLLEVQESIGGSIDLVSPTREVLKEGKIVKISARTADHQERYLFLSMISGPQFSLRAKFEVDNLQVLEGDNLVTANTFYVRDDQKSVELYTNTKTEKEEWLEFLFLAIKSLYTRKSSLKVGRDILRPLDSEIGKKQPHLQKLDNVQKCSECSSQFSILKHKHNCRFCGAVFCGKCTDLKNPVPWDEGKKGRSCKACHNILTSRTNSNQPTPELPVRPKGLLEVPASTPSVISGWLVLRPPGSRSGANKRYFILLPDFVLYSFRSEVDTSALTATPLPGYSVVTGAGLKGECQDKDRDKVIKMSHPSSKRTYYFAGTSPVQVERWAEFLQKASRAELLSPQDEDTKSTSQSTSQENEP